MEIKKEELSELIKIESDKINQISLIGEEQRSIIKESLQYTVIPYMPISKPFIQRYILNNMEYPLIESKLSQAAIEMRSKLNCLVDTQYQFQKCGIEIERLEVEKEEILNDHKMSEKKQRVEVADKDLEIKIRKFRLQSYKSGMDTCFNEFKNWSETVKDCVDAIKTASIEANRKDPNVPIINDFTEVNFDLIRTEEMKIKTRRWIAMENNGNELTPSQKIFTENEKIEAQIALLQSQIIEQRSTPVDKDQQVLESLKTTTIKV